ncbi:hypothetical protein SDC9_58990 [bioreactor metagenome]|uniref:Uncharacterized protein n=1 Tax=bioreactor metagenome TaxID=1076179 RepID=A0A644X8X6_9ZZZZ
MLRFAVDGRQYPVTYYNGADVPSRFSDEFLDVENGVLHGSKGSLVLHNGFGGVTVIDLGQQASPGTNDRFEDNRVAHGFNGLKGRLRREGCDGMGLRHPGTGKGSACHQLVTTNFCHPRSIDGGDTESIEHAQRV